MNKKETLYKKVQDLFPTELGEGDVVEWLGEELTIIKYREAYKGDNRQYAIIPHSIIKTPEAIDITHYEDLKLIRKRITLPMVLDKIVNVEISMLNDGIMEFASLYRRKEDEHAKTHYAQWQLRKDNKDLSLYDQSIETIKLVYEVLS